MRKVALLVFGINARRIGGIEVHTRELITRLAAQGWLSVLCFQSEPSPEVREFLSSPSTVWEQMPHASENSVQACLSLLAILRRHRPTLLHLQFTPFLSPEPWIARLNGVRKIIFTDHSSRPEGYTAFRRQAWIRLAARIVNLPLSCTVSVSDYNRAIIGSLGVFPVSRLRLVYNGVDLVLARAEADAGERFRVRYSIPPDRILVTQVSLMIPEKGIPDVLRAAALAVAVEPSLHFALVGDGEFRDEYIRLASELKISAHVTWTGMVRDPMTEGVYSATDIACQASRWQEAFGFVIAEAMAFSRPVVATRAGGIPELVEDGKTGLLVEIRDVAGLARNFVTLARDSDMRSRMGRAGRERAAKLFDVRRNVGTLIGLYGEHEASEVSGS